jgi:hypothetical protein
MFSFLEGCRFVSALHPVADAFDTLVYPTGIKMSLFERLAFVIMKGVGTLGTCTVQVVAGDDASPSNETAIEFRYRRITSADVPGSVQQATTAGFATTAGTGDCYVIEIDGKALAASGYKYAHLKLTELVNDPVIGAVLAIASVERYSDNTADIVS